MSENGAGDEGGRKAMDAERLAEIRKAAEQYRGSPSLRRKPNGAIAHRSELLVEVERLREIEAAYAEITDPEARRAFSSHSVSISAFAEQVAAKRDALAKLAEACREVNQLRGRQAAPTGVMTVPAAERFEAIRSRYHEFAFSGPDDVDRERDQVIGYLLGEVDARGDERDEIRVQADLDLRAVTAFLVETERADLYPPEPFDPSDHRSRAQFYLRNHFLSRIQDAIEADPSIAEREPLSADTEASDVMSSERLAEIDRRLGGGGGYTGAPTKHELRAALIELVDEVRRLRRTELEACVAAMRPTPEYFEEESRRLYEYAAQANYERGRADLRAAKLRVVLAWVLRCFTEKGHPGYDALRSNWVETAAVERWWRVFNETRPTAEAAPAETQPSATGRGPTEMRPEDVPGELVDVRAKPGESQKAPQ